MLAIPFCGQAYTDRSAAANAQTCINLYPFPSPTADNPSRLVLYPTPGYGLYIDTATFGIAGTGAIRGVFEINGVLYVVSGTQLLQINADGSATSRGTLTTAAGRCSIACNTVELVISDGTSGYTYNLASTAFAAISGGSWPTNVGVTNFTFNDGYILGAVNTSKQVIQSDLLAGGTYGAQSFVQQTSFPDNLVAVFSDQRQLYLFGPKQAEVRADAGTIPFAFVKVQGVLIEAGCVSWATVVKAGGTVLWLASDANGKAYIAALDGYGTKVMSTPPVNEAFERYNVTADAFAYTYREADNTFYVLTFPSQNVTWALELKTGAIHQRQAPDGGRDYPDHCVLYRGKHLVGGADGKLYWMSQEYSTYTDGSYLKRQRACQTSTADGDTLFLSELQIDIDAGMGLTAGQGSDPLATLEISRDGGHTWLSVGTARMGKVGEYSRRLTWFRLGRFRQRMTFRLTITDPVRVCVLGAWARVTKGTK